jgi:hypothetical protein
MAIRRVVMRDFRTLIVQKIFDELLAIIERILAK